MDARLIALLVANSRPTDRTIAVSLIVVFAKWITFVLGMHLIRVVAWIFKR